MKNFTFFVFNKKYIWLLIFGISFASAFAQSRKGNLHLKPNSSSHRLFVTFNDDTDTATEEIKILLDQYSLNLKKAYPLHPEKITELSQLALKKVGNDNAVKSLTHTFEVIGSISDDELLELGNELETLNAVKYCSLINAQPVKSPSDIPPATPLYFDQQTYITDFGVNMTYAWDIGLTGQGIRLRDIEGAFNPDHEEFNDKNVYYGLTLHPDIDDLTHGTGVFGIMYADNGDYGVTGLCYGAEEVVMYPEISVEYGYDVIAAITESINDSTEGDIIIYELQTYGALGDFGPAEYDSPIWDITKAATDAGIIVVAAAGNGSENMDDPAYAEYTARGDSGAIIVGAGSNDEFHNRLWFSTYGQRVDIQGWGWGVLTAGNDSAFVINEDENQNYGWFNGTSAATPIVASCAAVVQSYYHSVTGSYLNSIQMRELIKSTGTLQGTELEGNIGPLPNMPEAIAAIDSMLGLDSVKEETFIAYPNPVLDNLYLAGNFDADTYVKVYNILGQEIYSAPLENKTLNMADFAKGIYNLQIIQNGKTFFKKIVKN